MPELTALFRLLRIALMLTAFFFGVFMIFDPANDNRFRFLSIDIPNLWLGVGTLLCLVAAILRKPSYWWLWMYTLIPITVSAQRCIMIALDPTRAKLALAVYFGIASFIIITAMWGYQHGVTD